MTREQEDAEPARRADAEKERAEEEEAVQAMREAEKAERVRVESQRMFAQHQPHTEQNGTGAADKAAAQRREEEKAEAVRRHREALVAEQARRDAGAARERAEAEAAELRRRKEEEAEALRRHREELEAEQARRDAEAARERAKAEAADLRRREEEKAEALRQRREELEAEQARREAEAARERAEANAAERKRRHEEGSERARREMEAERERRTRETEERAKAEAEDRLRRTTATMIRARHDAEAAERALKEAEAARIARLAEEEKERARLREAAEHARLELAAAEQAKREAERAQEGGGDAIAQTPSEAAPLEVDDPFWERQPAAIAAQAASPAGAVPVEGLGMGGVAENARGRLPVTYAEETNTFVPPVHDEEEEREEARRAKDANKTEPVPVEKRMYIVMIAPEVAPCAKVGGLGDVVLGLGRELMRRGHGVEVICPMYSCMRYDQIQDLREEYAELWCPHAGGWRKEKVYQGKVEGGLQINFITGGNYTERPSIYGFQDDLERFTYFSRQALEFLFKSNRRPDIIHCHDWSTGLVPVIYWDVYAKLGWNNSRFVYTIHNNECQGLCGYGQRLLGLVGLDAKVYHRPDRLQDDAHPNCINMMKGGIVFSNFVTTVSPTYAGELKTVLGGRGLQTTIARNSAKVGGVLNGIDYDSWNPRTDPKLTARYSDGADFPEKYRNKHALRSWLGLNDAWKPIVSVVTRLTHQKGLDLIKHAIYSTLRMEGQFILLGSAPDPKVNADFLRIQHELRDNHDVNLYIGYHEDLSRLIYGGSDIFLVPSLYEPCGLTQMISLRYGTVPVVRETGGLVDTVWDMDNSGRGLNSANGFTFRDPTPQSLDYGLSRAVRLWYDNPEAFNRLAKNGMRVDYSWRHPAEHYENIYNYIKA